MKSLKITMMLLGATMSLSASPMLMAQEATAVPAQDSRRIERRFLPGRERSPFEATKVEYVMVIAINLNQQFQGRMQRDDAAFRYVFSLVESFTRNTVGSEARIVITQLGNGAQNPLLWEGSPREIRQQFQSPEMFQSFVLKNRRDCPPQAINGLVTTTKYLLNHEALDNEACRPALFIVSDAVDQRPYAETFKDCAELAKNFTDIAHLGGICGWYFVDHQNLDWAKEIVKRSGFKDFRVEADIVRRPSVPRFN